MSTLTVALTFLLAAGARAEDAATEARPQRHEVVHADTLWDLSKRYYKDPFQWRRIYEANKDSIKDPDLIYPNQVFVMPGLDVTVTVVPKSVPETAAETAPEDGPAAAAAAAPEPAPEAAPEPPPPAEPFAAKSAPGAIALPESLSTRMPHGMTSGQPSAYRLLMPAGWAADGTVRGLKDRDVMASAGDSVVIRVLGDLKVTKGLRFTVFRPGSPTESDADQKASYMEKVGVLEAVKRVGERDYRAAVVSAGGAVQTGDLVKAGD